MKAVRLAYVTATGLLIATVCLQVMLAGASILVGPQFLAYHVTVGHMTSIPIVLMLVLSLAGRMPSRFSLLAVGLYFLYGLQYFFLHWPPPQLAMLRSLHAANALAILAVASYTARSALAFVRTATVAHVGAAK